MSEDLKPGDEVERPQRFNRIRDQLNELLVIAERLEVFYHTAWPGPPDHIRRVVAAIEAELAALQKTNDVLFLEEEN